MYFSVYSVYPMYCVLSLYFRSTVAVLCTVVQVCTLYKCSVYKYVWCTRMFCVQVCTFVLLVRLLYCFLLYRMYWVHSVLYYSIKMRCTLYNLNCSILFCKHLALIWSSPYHSYSPELGEALPADSPSTFISPSPPSALLL